MRENISVALIDDHEMVLQGLKALLSSLPGIRVLHVWTNGFEAIENAKNMDVDIFLVDVNMPTINGFETSRQLLADNEQSKIIFLSMEIKKAYLEEAKSLGARGYISKNASIEELVGAIKEVAAGETYFLANN